MHCSFVFPEDIPRPTPGDEALKQALKTADKNVKKEYYEKLGKTFQKNQKYKRNLLKQKPNWNYLKKHNVIQIQIMITQVK